MIRFFIKLFFILHIIYPLSTNAQIVNIKDLSDGWHKVNLGSGMFYDGEILAGKIDGKGIMTWADSSSYSGTWKLNMKQGKGTMKWKNGDVYMGNFKKDDINGFGTFAFADGHKYVGCFKNGNFNGKGKLIFIDGKIEKGIWINGKQKTSITKNDTTF